MQWAPLDLFDFVFHAIQALKMCHPLRWCMFIFLVTQQEDKCVLGVGGCPRYIIYIYSWLHCLVFLLIVHSWKNPWLASGARGGFKNHPARHQPPPGTVQQLCTRDVKMHSGTVGHSPRHAILEKVHRKIRNAQICIRLTAQCCTPSHWTLNFKLDAHCTKWQCPAKSGENAQVWAAVHCKV